MVCDQCLNESQLKGYKNWLRAKLSSQSYPHLLVQERKTNNLGHKSRDADEADCRNERML